MPQEKGTSDLPATSLRAQAQERALAFQSDARAETGASALLPLSISFIVILFVSFLLFGILGPDANEICSDTVNYTAEECDNATQARGLFWVFLIIVGVAHVLIALAVARKAVDK